MQQGSPRDRVHRLRAVLRHARAGSRATRGGHRFVSTVRMPPILRQAVGGAREVDASGGTVREVLDDLTGRYPAIRTHLFDDGGDLNRVRERLREQRGRAPGQRPRDGGRAGLDRDRAAGDGRGGGRMSCLETRRSAALTARRKHAADRAAADVAAPGRAHLREARGAEPDRLDEGPGRALDGRDGRGHAASSSPAGASSSRPAATRASPWR